MKTAAIYARVSSDKQREENTIASQTAALITFAREQQFEVPQEWVFEDDGYSGASLIRPGLERVRDLAAEGLIQAILVYAPDRLSRRYAHQILLIEELARAGVETLFVRAPRGSTPEDELLVQFQGMIAEYERAQILERSRRGKRHRARQGEVSVLSGAPFGYHFIRKTDHSAAYYEIDEEQARVVRRVFELYGVDGLSIGAIAHLLNEQAIPTCKRRGRWERSTVWGMLRNPAYKGQACFGKTTIAPRQRITRPIRLRGGVATRNSASHERPREDWITIPVPPIVSEETFALAQERLEANKAHAPRRTVTPSVVQGLVSCAKCGYALYRTSTRSSARAIHYYRCLGSDAWRRLSGSVCNNRPVRQDLLDEVVWAEVVRLLENPQLIQSELERRLAAAREADPTKRHEEALRRELVRIRKSIDRLLTAYQEGLLALDELRERMPNLRRREQADNAQLQAIANQSVERATYLRLAETLTTFLTRLRSSADALDISERQRVLRLLVKEILVGDDKIVIRHCIPLPTGGNGPRAKSVNAAVPSTEGYLLRSRSHLTVACQHLPALRTRPLGRALATARKATGDMIIVRYADDFIVGFQHHVDARCFLDEMRERLREFALSLHPEKTRLIEFGRFAAESRKRLGLGKPETFDFMGFTFTCGKTRAGKFQLRRRSRRDRMKAKLRMIKDELRQRMHQPIPKQGRWLERVVRGYFNYHAVPTNARALDAFRHHVTDLWRRTLRRRSQKGRLTWERMTQLADAWLPKPIILHPWPSERFAVTHPRWEPYAGKPHVRFCAGGAS